MTTINTRQIRAIHKRYLKIQHAKCKQHQGKKTVHQHHHHLLLLLLHLSFYKLLCLRLRQVRPGRSFHHHFCLIYLVSHYIKICFLLRYAKYWPTFSNLLCRMWCRVLNLWARAAQYHLKAPVHLLSYFHSVHCVKQFCMLMCRENKITELICENRHRSHKEVFFTDLIIQNRKCYNNYNFL